MKTALLVLMLCAGCGDDSSPNGIGPDSGMPADAAIDGAGSGTRDPDAMPPAMANVPGGTFYRSWDGVTSMGMNKSYPATVSSFSLDTYEVTVARFRAFVAATGFDATPLACTPSSMQTGTWTAAPGANEQKPINCVTWADAKAFCAWDLGRLPTEAEWNYAAAGGDEQRVFPWSVPATDQTLDNQHANIQAKLADVGSCAAGNGRWGHADLTGNVSEWVADYYADPYQTPCADCVNTTPGNGSTSRRGGGIGATTNSGYPVVVRAVGAANYRSVAVGFRCARTP